MHPGEVEPWVYNETLEDADIDLAADLADHIWSIREVLTLVPIPTNSF